MKNSVRGWAAATAASCFMALVPLDGHAAKVSKITTPTIDSAGETQVSVDVRVGAPAGGTGLPAGFSLQWMTADDYVANGNAWFASTSALLCKASFSGNAKQNLSRYNLKAGESVTVRIGGEFLLDEGASTNAGQEVLIDDVLQTPCPGNLACGTEYVFRAFGHANGAYQRSDFTANLSVVTDSCGGDNWRCFPFGTVFQQGVQSSCSVTQGYWKTHSLEPKGQNSNDWPESVKTGGLTLGNVSYTEQELLDILQTPVGGNGLIALAHQLITAKLNIANGADGAIIQADIIAADALIGDLSLKSTTPGFLAPTLTSTLVYALANYNEGGYATSGGPCHCDAEEPEPELEPTV